MNFTREILTVILVAILGIGGGISLFAGSQRGKLTWKEVISMIFVGAIAAVFGWSYVDEGISQKKLVSTILGIVLITTALTKLIFNLVRALITIPEEKWQKMAIDFARKKIGLNETDSDNEDSSSDNSTDYTDNPPIDGT